MKNWYAVYVKPRAEKKVSQILEEKTLVNYLPIKKSLRQWSDRKKWVETPVISGYVFVNIKSNERINVLKTDFVVGFVRYLGKDAIIPENQINAMKYILGDSDFNAEFNFNNYQKGQPVRVIAGPLIGLQGELINIKNKKKINVRLEHINVNILLELPINHIEVLNQTKKLQN